MVCPCTASLALGAADSELNVAKATRSKIDAFGVQYQGKAGFSTPRFSWAA